MNQKIKELAEQVYGNDVHYDDGVFAELIIQECAKICNNLMSGSPNEMVGRAFAEEIKKHFGIE